MSSASKLQVCLVALLLTGLIGVKADCNSKGVACVNETAYQTCWSFLFMTFYSEVASCDDGYTCDETTGTDSCIQSATTVTTTTTTTSSSVTCGTKAIHCFNDTSYQTCITIGGNNVLFGNVRDCSTGTVCDEDTGDENCISPSATSLTVSSTTSTTTASTTTSPTSTTTSSTTTSTASTTSSTASTTTSTASTTTTPTTTTTSTEPTSTSTSSTTTSTASTTTSTASTSTTTASASTTTPTAATTSTTTSTSTTTEPSTSTTTVATVVTGLSDCSSGEKWPSTDCYAYYECILVLWNYYIVEKNCTNGTIYNSVSGECDVSTSCYIPA
ncbi:hypothetical protein GWI33_022086 [Rhynchophorus ferrugineus]|uniref:Chitin-binding type-2 domain-containing protein n=2 Tax=Rhynchophorus ferrugineus TaxID=354439 RepID=A0A834IR82_RHYFE|nr:hypothetical protein GWI33_022086 [Rhynchophorus ferrugineus]